MKDHIVYDKQGKPSTLPYWVNLHYYLAKGFSLEPPEESLSRCAVVKEENTPEVKTTRRKRQ